MPACDGVGVQVTTPVSASTARFFGVSIGLPAFRALVTLNFTPLPVALSVNLIGVLVSWLMSGTSASVRPGCWAGTADMVSATAARSTTNRRNERATERRVDGMAGPHGRVWQWTQVRVTRDGPE